MPSGPYAPPGGNLEPSTRTNGVAIASLIMSLVPVCGIGSVLAVIFGYIARRQIRERGEQGAGLALAGIIIGWIGIALLVIYLVGFVLLSVTDSGSSS